MSYLFDEQDLKDAKQTYAEQALVTANRELIARFERKIQTAIARVWGEPSSPTLLPDSLVPRREKGDVNYNVDAIEIGQGDANDEGDNNLGGIFEEKS